MTTPTDMTLALLREIRAEVRKTNERLDGTNTRLDHLDQRVEGGFARVDTELAAVRTEIADLRDEVIQRITASEVRTATAITDLAGTVGELTAAMRRRSHGS
jgi:hypothetical protein